MDAPTVPCPYCRGSGRIAPSAIHAGLLIAARRNALGMTQADVAEKIGRSRAQLANIETGRTDMPVTLLQRLASTLDCRPADLLP